MKPENIKFLWSLLWQDYCSRVKYARIYEEMITAAGGMIANDHIAFRSLNINIDTPQGKVNLGVEYLEKIATFLGYEVVGEYHFSETHLFARHYCHPQQEQLDLPKLFISELIVDELPEYVKGLIQETVSLISRSLFQGVSINPEELPLNLYFTRPWQFPRRSVVDEVNQVTQYGAWVLLHGYAVNHFTGYVNRQNTPKYPDIDSTVSGLASLGVPMKTEIEGNITTGLRQTATQAVTEIVTVLDDINNAEIQIPWTYAYYEIAQRYLIEVAPGKEVLFDAFLGNNAQNLFEMTRLKNN